MALKITVKPLKGDNFEVEAQPEAKVEDLKKLIAAVRPEFAADAQKLIHSGRILKDEDTVESIGIKPGEFVVVMVTKAKPPAAPTPSAEPAPAPAATPAAEAGGIAADQAAATSVTGEGVEAAIAQLCDMGFERPEVEKCLAAAFGNPDRAVEYLMSGIPEAILRENAAPPPAAAGGSAPPLGGGRRTVAIPPELAEIRNNPQFTQLAAMIAQQPQMLAQLLPVLQQSHPQIAQAIQEHPEAFLQMIAEVGGMGGGGQDPVAAMLAAAQQQGGGGGGGAPPGSQVIRLTEEEGAAVDRLASLGFDRNMAAQAYLACDKNEEMAANFLFDNGDGMQD